MAYLIVSHSCLDDGSTETSCDANRYATNHATHKDIPQHALLAISNDTEALIDIGRRRTIEQTWERSRRQSPVPRRSEHQRRRGSQATGTAFGIL